MDGRLKMNNITKKVKCATLVTLEVSEYETVEVYRTLTGRVYSYHVAELPSGTETTPTKRHADRSGLLDVAESEKLHPAWIIG